MPPKKHAHEPPEYEVLDAAGRIVGWLEAKYLGGKHPRLFYTAIALHPVTGDRVDVDSSPDVDHELFELTDFLSSPDDYAQRKRARPPAPNRAPLHSSP
ncbi:hypothetical protein D7I44_17880 (plasmid) [Gryllotalpicola protaetiae]|uniref:Uncharacterized protein n=2 Tax=Gryllotalpicola protaetiae TaxID=2419771 RepID=A0A387BXH3_9MICO|nr:hypothetical protein D7I44_17880 [Gryllotalpicola protaetiae]